MTQFKAFIAPCGSGGVAGFRISSIDTSTLLPPGQYLAPHGGKKSSLHIRLTGSDLVHFEVNQKFGGTTELLLTDKTGKIIRRKSPVLTNAGKRDDSMNIAGLAAGIYYLSLVLDKRVEHIQEVIIL